MPATTTTQARAQNPAPSRPSNALFSASFEDVSPFSFGQSKNKVLDTIGSEFGQLRFSGSSNWDDFAVVDDPSGAYLRTRSNTGNNSQKQFNIPITQASESYLVYSFFLEPGFDAGDGNRSHGAPSHSTGIKLPGLILGNPSDNTGGNHTPGGFSGRLMIRGTRKSDGDHTAPRQGLSLAAYIYGQEINNQSIASGFGRDYFFLDGFSSSPFEGISRGHHEGVGDPRIWDLEVGQWVTVVLGYRVDGDNGSFRAWTKTGNGPLTQQLHIPNVNWAGGNSKAGPDSILLQNFWGGSGSVWYPDSTSYMRFKDFAVFNSQADALAWAR